jgi:hypothetical protein
VLSVRLYQQSQATTDAAQNQQTVIIDNRSNQETQQGLQKANTKEEVSAEEEVLTIPVEDITRISFKTEIKKGLQADVEFETIPEYKPTENFFDRCAACLCCCCGAGVVCACLPCLATVCCCNELKRCCKCDNNQVHVSSVVHNLQIVHSTAAPKKNRRVKVKNDLQPLPKEPWWVCFDCVRCWCCRRKKLVGLVKRTTTVAEEQAKRVITMTLEYGSYTILETGSNVRVPNVRVPNGEPQAIHSKQQFANTRLEFYLIANTDYDPRNFNQYKHQAELLCRTVMHLQGMRNYYPSETELDKILEQPHQIVFGTVFQEPVLQLERDLNPDFEDPQIQNSPEPPPIEQKPETVSEPYEEGDRIRH